MPDPTPEEQEQARTAVNHVMGWSGPDHFSCDKGGYTRLKDMLIEQVAAAFAERRGQLADLIEPKLNAVRACVAPLAWCLGPSPTELDDVDWDELKLHFSRDEIEEAQGAERIIDEAIEIARNPDA